MTSIPQLAALARQRLAHAVLPDERGQLEVVTVYVPEEGPTDHIRNALQAVACLEANCPAVYVLTAELARAERRAHAAVVLLEHGGAPSLAVPHVRGAIESLIEAPLDWEFFPEIRAAIARLLHAWYPLDALV